MGIPMVLLRSRALKIVIMNCVKCCTLQLLKVIVPILRGLPHLMITVKSMAETITRPRAIQGAIVNDKMTTGAVNRCARLMT